MKRQTSRGTHLIQIGNLPGSVDSKVLQQLFEAYAPVRSAYINRHMDSNTSTGVGLVEMVSRKGGATAIAALNHREYEGMVLAVAWSGPRMHKAAEPEPKTSVDIPCAEVWHAAPTKSGPQPGDFGDRS